jgi:hypothetical protein
MGAGEVSFALATCKCAHVLICLTKYSDFGGVLSKIVNLHVPEASSEGLTKREKKCFFCLK